MQLMNRANRHLCELNWRCGNALAKSRTGVAEFAEIVGGTAHAQREERGSRTRAIRKHHDAFAGLFGISKYFL